MAELAELFLANGYKIDQKQESEFLEYYRLLIEYNNKFNLTAIVERDQVFVKHFLDSVVGEKHIPYGATVVDVGSGAGFPAIPLKIVRPDLKFTLVDGLNKRVEFLKTVVNALKLSDVECVHKRAEEMALERREWFDAAVARGVSKLSTLAEYCLPLVRVGGRMVAYKGEGGLTEMTDGANAVKILGGKPIITEEFLLANEYKRSFLVIEKVRITDKKYPRSQNKAKNFPL